MELRLAGGAPSSVNQGAALAAEASLRTRGSGLLRARWTVDGRVLENVVLNHAGQAALVLRTGPATRLPTFEPGTHELVLEILQPVPAFEPPVLRYFVRPGGARGAPVPAGPA